MLKLVLGFMLVIAPNFLMIIAVVLALIGIIGYSHYTATEKRGKQINDTIQKTSDAHLQAKEDGNMEVGIVAGEVANLSATEQKRLAMEQAEKLNHADIAVVMAAISGKSGTYAIRHRGLYHEGVFADLRAPEFRVNLRNQRENRRVYEITEGLTRFVLVAERTSAWMCQYLQDEQGKKHDFAWEIEMCVVLEKCDESCILTISTKLEELLKKSSVTMIRENLKEIVHYEGVKLGTDLIFSPSALTPQSLSNEELDHFYAPIEYKVDGVPVVVKMRNFVTACTEALTRNINVFLCGKPGTGKTRLATFVMGQLTLSDENVTILNINAAILQAICGENSYQFIQFLDRYAKGDGKVVIYIDDAHKALNSMHDELKSMLDGTYSNHYNLAVLASMNESSDTLQKEKGDLSRPGRVSTFDIKPLTAQQANVAAAFIAANPLMKRIGKTSFTKETTLAVLWDSFVKKEKPNPFKILASDSDEPVTINL